MSKMAKYKLDRALQLKDGVRPSGKSCFLGHHAVIESIGWKSMQYFARVNPNIHVRLPDGNAWIRLTNGRFRSIRVRDLKGLIQGQCGIPWEEQELCYLGQQLDGMDYLYQHGLEAQDRPLILVRYVASCAAS